MKKTRLFFMALVLQLCVTLGFGTVVSYGNTRDRAPSGLVVWGQDFSGLSRVQATEKLKEKLPTAVTYENQIFLLNWERTYVEIDQWLDRVYPKSTGLWFIDALKHLTRSSTISSLDSIRLDQTDIKAQLQAFSRNVNQSPRLATLEFAEGRFIKKDGLPGKELDIEATWLKISQEREQKYVEAVIKSVVAVPSTADLDQIQDNLGDYTTYFNPQEKQRTNNVRLAALALNHRLIPPGELFSFNEVVGERTSDTGYSPAIVFVNQSMIQDIGGGICQDSSTLYQAVRQANLAIEEKHTHSLPVSYVLRGQDATVSYGSLDFRFRNDTKGYLLISAQTGTNWLRIRLFGLSDERHPELQTPEGYPKAPESWQIEPAI